MYDNIDETSSAAARRRSWHDLWHAGPVASLCASTEAFLADTKRMNCIPPVRVAAFGVM